MGLSYFEPLGNEKWIKCKTIRSLQIDYTLMLKMIDLTKKWEVLK